VNPREVEPPALQNKRTDGGGPKKDASPKQSHFLLLSQLLDEVGLGDGGASYTDS